MSRFSHRCCRAALVALLMASLPAPSGAVALQVELVGQVGLISPIDPTVAAPLTSHGVEIFAPVTAFIVWDTTTPGVIDPETGKTVYDGAILDAEIQIGTYVVSHARGFPIDDQNTVIVGDDKEAIASPAITDTILGLAGGFDTDGILSPDPPADEGVSMAFGFEGDTSVLMDQGLLTDQETIDLFFDGGAIEAQVGSTKGFIRIGFTAATVPEPGQGLLVVIGGAVLFASGAIRRRAAGGPAAPRA